MSELLVRHGVFVLLLLVACDASVPPQPAYQRASSCEGCHPDHAQEWRGSIMHYAARSPVFNAMELAMRELSNGATGADGSEKNFCSKCHSPVSNYLDELPGLDGRTAYESMSEVGRDGVSCDVCHTVIAADVEASINKDGLANLAFKHGPSETKQGTFDDAHESRPHGAMRSDYLRSSEFCGACHDVRLPQPDAVTGESFMRVENLFTEWSGSLYAAGSDQDGDAVSCQDCHMSLYPLTAPGVYPKTVVASGATETRRHAMHAFTAVSIPLIDDPEFPNVDTEQVDRFGYPLGQKQRRQLMLRAACRIDLAARPTLPRDAESFTLDVTVTNVGAGHNVPSGFSEERQVWLQVVAEDDEGVLYRSGYLTDRPHPETGESSPDGRLHDEPLQDVVRMIDSATLEEVTVPGPDADLVNFQNAFVRVDPDGRRHDVVNPLLANTVDNGRSLPPGVPRRVSYTIQLERQVVGDIHVSVVLRYRSFPPEFMRALAVRYPGILSEETVDRNTIVDMAEADTTIRIH